jgi:hypothetical protein
MYIVVVVMVLMGIRSHHFDHGGDDEYYLNAMVHGDENLSETLIQEILDGVLPNTWTAVLEKIHSGHAPTKRHVLLLLLHGRKLSLEPCKPQQWRRLVVLEQCHYYKVVIIVKMYCKPGDALVNDSCTTIRLRPTAVVIYWNMND